MALDFNTLEGYDTNFKVSESKITIPIQKSLLGYGRMDMRSRVSIGNFYENLTLCIFGGKHHIREKIVEDAFLICEPDSTNHNEEIHFESKGVSIRGDCKLYDHQTQKYFLLQLGKGAYKSPVIIYAIYLHDCIGITNKTDGNLEKVISELSKSNKLMLILPFSIIWEIHRNGNYRSFYRVFGSEKCSTEYMTRFRPKEMYKFMLDPEQSIKDFNLNPEDYIIVKRKLPEGMKINKTIVKDFPILYVQDKNHSKSLKRFKEKYSSLEEGIISELEYLTGKKIDSSKERFLFQQEKVDIEEEVPF